MAEDSKIKGKDKILDAAAEEFAEHGLAGARVDRIAERAGVNKALIYYHFNSKDNLYKEIIKNRITVAADFISQRIEKVDDPEQLLKMITHFYHEYFELIGPLRSIILREIADGGENFRSALKGIMTEKSIHLKVKSIFERGIEEGKFRDIDIRQAIISFIGMNVFYLIMSPVVNSIWEIDDEKKFRDERREEIIDLFLHGIKKR